MISNLQQNSTELIIKRNKLYLGRLTGPEGPDCLRWDVSCSRYLNRSFERSGGTQSNLEVMLSKFDNSYL